MEYDKNAIIAGLFIALISICIVLFIFEKNTATPAPWEISDKCEVDGKCYVQVWHEVTPEEYIGLDIGDEYQLHD